MGVLLVLSELHTFAGGLNSPRTLDPSQITMTTPKGSSDSPGSHTRDLLPGLAGGGGGGEEVVGDQRGGGEWGAVKFS